MICFLYHICNMQLDGLTHNTNLMGFRSFDYSTNRILHNLHAVSICIACWFMQCAVSLQSTVNLAPVLHDVKRGSNRHTRTYIQNTIAKVRLCLLSCQATHECVVSTIGRSRLHTHFARWCATHDHRQTHWPLRLGHSPWRPKKSWRKRQRKRRPKLRLKLMLM